MDLTTYGMLSARQRAAAVRWRTQRIPTRSKPSRRRRRLPYRARIMSDTAIVRLGWASWQQ